MRRLLRMYSISTDSRLPEVFLKKVDTVSSLNAFVPSYFEVYLITLVI